MEWYKQFRLDQALYSITRPASLRYDDLITEVKKETQIITNYSMMSSQTEQRDMPGKTREVLNLTTQGNHGEQEDILGKPSSFTTMVAQFRESLVLDQATNASAQTEVRCKPTDIQLDQALSFISSRCNIDHTSCLRAAIALRDGHRSPFNSSIAGFWMSPQLRGWNASSVSSALLLKGTFRQRREIRDFCASVIEQLLDNQAVSLWVLRDEKERSLQEVFKSLILQALSLNYLSHPGAQLNFQLQKFLDAQIDDDYLNILGDVIQHFKLVYIVADIGAMSADEAARCRISLHQLSQRLAGKKAQTVLKIIVSLCGPAKEIAQWQGEDVVLDVGRSSMGMRERKRKQLGRRAGQKLCQPSRPSNGHA